MKDDFKTKIKEKKIEIENGIRMAYHKTSDYICNNPQEAAVIASFAIAVGGEGVKQIGKINKQIQKRKDEEREMCRFWDPVNGKNVYSYRPLTVKELALLDTRREEGASVTRALLEMGLIR